MRRRHLVRRPAEQLGTARHLLSIVNQHELRRGRVVAVEVVQELLALAADRQQAAAAVHADAARLVAMAAEIRAGTVELPEPQPLEELVRDRRRRFMETN